MIASAVAMVMTAGSAMAAPTSGGQGEVQFVGTVVAKTCDIVVEGGGAVNNTIQFGTVNVNGNTSKDFTLKFKDDGTCVGSATKASFLWKSPNLTNQGFTNQSGTADKAYVELRANDGVGNNVASNKNLITSTNNTVDFTIANASEGFAYKATLQGGATAGTFETAAAYSVVYE